MFKIKEKISDLFNSFLIKIIYTVAIIIFIIGLFSGPFIAAFTIMVAILVILSLRHS